MSSDMDSGLGSDEDRRGSRTKEEKQLHNQQLLSGCFIDAASLSDDAEVVDQRRNDERRQGALIFQTSIPQFSMLQISSSEGPDSTYAETSTPYNSIVQLDGSEDADQARNRSPLGFYVDLSQVPDTPKNVSSTSSKKNIFSMVIDFEGPKKDKPVKLSSSCIPYKKPKPKPNLLNFKGTGSLSSSVSSVNSLCVASTSRQSEDHETRTNFSHNDVSSIAVLSASLVKNLSITSSKSSSDESSDRNVVEKSEDEPLGESMILEDCDNDDGLSSSKELEGSLFSKQPASSEPISLEANSDCGSSDSGNHCKEVKNVNKQPVREQKQVSVILPVL